jgi:Spy/CpxP family protein refolding chaperone
MKRLSLIAIMVLGGLVAFSTLANAQDDTNAKKKRGFSPEQQLERMTTTLTLTDEQKPKVKAVLDEQQKKMAALRDETDQETRRTKGQELRKETTEKMKKILTPEQFTKYEAMSTRGGGKKKKSDQ